MSNLELLRTSMVALLDGMWWGLRDNVGPLSMYEGYERGFKQIGEEAAEKIGEKGPKAAAKTAHEIFTAIGLKTELDGAEITVHRCPIWDRILERGLEYAFHVEKICWKPMLLGIGEKLGAHPEMETSLRLNFVSKAKLEYKIEKAKKNLEKDRLTKEDYDAKIKKYEEGLAEIQNVGKYKFT